METLINVYYDSKNMRKSAEKVGSSHELLKRILLYM